MHREPALKAMHLRKNPTARINARINAPLKRKYGVLCANLVRIMERIELNPTH